MNLQKTKRAILFLLTALTFAMLSPKWTFSLAAWVAPGMLLYFIRNLKPWKAYLTAVAILFLSTLIGLYKVMPFPTVVFVVISFITSLQLALPYWLDRMLRARYDGMVITLLFPCALTALEYVTSFGGSGTWGSIAYTQASNLYLMQSASLVGIWGITFLIGWFASIAVWATDRQWCWSNISRLVYVFGCIVSAVLLFGIIRVNGYLDGSKRTVRVAGITDTNLGLLQSMYEATYGREIVIHEDDISQTSAELMELQKGLVAFVESAGDHRFSEVKRKLLTHQDSLFALSAKQVAAGSKIVAWSEALAIVLKQDEEILIEKGGKFASQHKVYLLMTLAAVHPGKIVAGKKFIENKAVFFSPNGKILKVFFKNKPVPMVEPSVAGDGIVPVIQTPYGNVAISICYDADFPTLMRQLSDKDADILLLPSGDWKEISPYHGQIASVRAIENGVSLLRPVSFAISMATDKRGKVIGARDYFSRGEKVLVADIPVDRISTLYSVIGDAFAWVCLGGLVMFVIHAILQNVKHRSALRRLRSFR